MRLFLRLNGQLNYSFALPSLADQPLPVFSTDFHHAGATDPSFESCHRYPSGHVYGADPFSLLSADRLFAVVTVLHSEAESGSDSASHSEVESESDSGSHSGAESESDSGSPPGAVSESESRSGSESVSDSG